MGSIFWGSPCSRLSGLRVLSEGHAAGQDLLGVRVFREWFAGEPREHRRVFLVESAAAAPTLGAVTGPEDALLLPVEASYRGPARVVRYRGALSDSGDELFFGEHSVEVQDYVAASFVHLIGPTAVRFFDTTSWQAFLDDADLARRTGVFPSAMLDLRVLLADRRAIRDPEAVETPHAIRIHDDGRVSVGAQGETIGNVADLPTLLAGVLPGSAALGEIAARQRIVADLRRREWIARYLDAADLMKMLRLTNGVARIAGFGWSLLQDDLADAEALMTDPFLIDSSEGVVLADTRTLRRQLLSPLTAVVVAATQTSRTPELAAARVARECGMPTAQARDLCLEAVAVLGIHWGGPRMEGVSR